MYEFNLTSKCLPFHLCFHEYLCHQVEYVDTPQMVQHNHYYRWVFEITSDLTQSSNFLFLQSSFHYISLPLNYETQPLFQSSMLLSPDSIWICPYKNHHSRMHRTQSIRFHDSKRIIMHDYSNHVILPFLKLIYCTLTPIYTSMQH